MRKLIKSIAFGSIIFIGGCSIESHFLKMEGFTHIKNNHYKDAYKKFKESLRKTDDILSCELLYGFVYSLNKNLNNLLQPYEDVLKVMDNRRLSYEERINGIRKGAKYYKNSFNYLDIELQKDAFAFLSQKKENFFSFFSPNLKKDDKKLIRNLLNKYCYLSENKYQCNTKFIVGLLRTLVNRGKCSWKKFVEYVDWEYSFKPSKIPNLLYTDKLVEKLENYNDKYLALKKDILTNFVKYVEKNSDKKVKICKFRNALRYLKEKANFINDFSIYSSKIEQYRRYTFDRIRKLVKKAYGNCDSLNCKSQIYLYSIYVTHDNKNYKEAKNSVFKLSCINLNVSSDDAILKKSFEQRFYNEFPLVSKESCQNTLNVFFKTNFSFHWHKESFRDYTYYSTLEPSEYKEILSFKRNYEAYYPIYCSSCSDPENCYYQLNSHFGNVYSFLQGLFAAQSAYETYTQALSVCYRYSRPEDYNRCLREAEEAKKRYYRNLLYRLCNRLNDYYYQKVPLLQSTLRRLDYVKNTYIYDYSINVKSTVDLSSIFANYAFYKKIEKRFSDEYTTDEYIIFNGDYEQACRYASEFSVLNGKNTVCVRPQKPHPISREEAYERISRTGGESLAELISQEITDRLSRKFKELSNAKSKKRYIYLTAYQILNGKIPNKDNVLTEIEGNICSLLNSK